MGTLYNRDRPPNNDMGYGSTSDLRRGPPRFPQGNSGFAPSINQRDIEQDIRYQLGHVQNELEHTQAKLVEAEAIKAFLLDAMVARDFGTNPNVGLIKTENAALKREVMSLSSKLTSTRLENNRLNTKLKLAKRIIRQGKKAVRKEPSACSRPENIVALGRVDVMASPTSPGKPKPTNLIDIDELEPMVLDEAVLKPERLWSSRQLAKEQDESFNTEAVVQFQDAPDVASPKAPQDFIPSPQPKYILYQFDEPIAEPTQGATITEPKIIYRGLDAQETPESAPATITAQVQPAPLEAEPLTSKNDQEVVVYGTNETVVAQSLPVPKPTGIAASRYETPVIQVPRPRGLSASSYATPSTQDESLSASRYATQKVEPMVGVEASRYSTPVPNTEARDLSASPYATPPQQSEVRRLGASEHATPGLTPATRGFAASRWAPQHAPAGEASLFDRPFFNHKYRGHEQGLTVWQTFSEDSRHATIAQGFLFPSPEHAPHSFVIPTGRSHAGPQARGLFRNCGNSHEHAVKGPDREEVLFVPEEGETNTKRGVVIHNLPHNVTLRDVMRAVNAGPIVSVYLARIANVLDPSTGIPVVKVSVYLVFLEENNASALAKACASAMPLLFTDATGTSMRAQVTHIQTATPPLAPEVRNGVLMHGWTRTLAIVNPPTDFSRDNLNRILTHPRLAMPGIVEAQRLSTTGTIVVEFQSIYTALWAIEVLRIELEESTVMFMPDGWAGVMGEARKSREVEGGREGGAEGAEMGPGVENGTERMWEDIKSDGYSEGVVI
ncbi:hypothetical protein K432DRAFT_464984 [Lepidopterella palustris CBS 459.81]|uniref:Uncharacterized protein n=1 Tax=Lepidopterella palustris CBS 459.81 TaxID=1314670 RepID=A0A8E2E1Q3_9PEZI|nr:hypothetical protein K432DRAFT_464984 [Lepidopterella palustris CBS 459.81]